MEIIESHGINDIKIMFLDDNNFITKTTYSNFKRGSVLNPYDKTTYNIGYLGEGEWSSIKSNPINIYYIWRGILERCYSEKSCIKYKSYYNICTVCKEWHNYQNFAEWYFKNYYQVDNERMHLDKDILIKNNKIYSPDTCLIVPQRINMLFMQKRNSRNLPNGITLIKNGKYLAKYNGNNIGVFNKLEDAVDAHGCKQIEHIRKIAEEYKDKIPLKVYEALYLWDYKEK